MTTRRGFLQGILGTLALPVAAKLPTSTQAFVGVDLAEGESVTVVGVRQGACTVFATPSAEVRKAYSKALAEAIGQKFDKTVYEILTRKT